MCTHSLNDVPNKLDGGKGPQKSNSPQTTRVRGAVALLLETVSLVLDFMPKSIDFLGPFPSIGVQFSTSISQGFINGSLPRRFKDT